MRLAVIPQALVGGATAATRLADLDAWIARAGGHVPDLAPVWAARFSDGGPPRWVLDRHLLAGLRSRSIEPVIYAESTGAPYRDILAGAFDTDLALLGCQADGLWLRWDQEPDGSGLGAKWQTPAERALYAETWVYVRTILRRFGDVRLIWSPVDPSRAAEMGLFPGASNVDVMGFTRFNRTPEAKPPSIRWRRHANDCRALAPDAPVMVTEAGVEALVVPLPDRAAYIRDLANVEAATGIEAAAVFDMLIEIPARPPDRPAPIRDDWRWSPRMYREWGRLSA